jgi:AcrR family transcriptional regulator
MTTHQNKPLSSSRTARPGRKHAGANGKSDGAPNARRAAPPNAVVAKTLRQPHGRNQNDADKSLDRRAKRASTKREAILAAALAEFSKRGFAATRIDDVARRARVAKGTIYLYFKDKDALFQELVRSSLAPTMARLAAPLPDDMPTRALFESFASVFIDEIVTTPRVNILRLMITEGKQFPKLAEFYYREVVSKGLAAMRALIARGRERGEIRSDALARNPQLVITPIMLAVIWNGLFDKFGTLDARDLINTQLDLIFDQGRTK